jgi:hypothetical protein
MSSSNSSFSSRSNSNEDETPDYNAMTNEEVSRMLDQCKRESNIEELEQLRAKKRARALEPEETPNPGLDALLAAASASQAPSAIRTSEKRALDIDGNDLGEMIDKKNFPDDAYNTNTERRMFDSGRREAFSSKGSTHWAPEKIMAEVRARSIENLPHLSMLSGDRKLINVWVSTALLKDIKDFQAIKDEVKFALFVKFEFKHGVYSSKKAVSLCDFGVEPNFDRAEPETAMRSLVKSVKGLELSLACVHGVTYLHSLDFLTDELNYGKLNLRNARFVRLRF